MSILSLEYIEAHTLNGKRLFRGKEEVGFIRNADFERFKKNRDVEPSIQLHPSQFSISEPLEEEMDISEAIKNVTDAINDIPEAVKNVTDAINEFNEALKNSRWKEVDSNDQ